MTTISSMLANRKLHDRINFRGLKISIENRKGSVRQGKDKDGKAWSSFYWTAYGYIRGVALGADGEQLDCFVGPNEDAKNVYVVHIKDPESGKYDEDKIMLGFMEAGEAKRQFLRHYNDKKFYAGIDTIPFEEFSSRISGRKQISKLTASLSVGDGVVANGIQYRGVISKLKGKMCWIQYRGAFNHFNSKTIMRPITAVTKI